MVDDITDSQTEISGSELVFAFVAPLGTPLEIVQEALIEALDEHDYSLETTVRISHLLGGLQAGPSGERPEQRQERLMDVGNHRRAEHGGDFLARMAIAAINQGRPADTGNHALPHQRAAHLVRSLKHPDEVLLLRHVYGKGFFLIGVSAPLHLRLEALIGRNFPRDEAKRLLKKDEAEEDRIGQQTRDAFELADAFLRITDDRAAVRSKIRRIVDILMSCPFAPPTREEHSMFMAYSAALRSSDLSRQVGAVITNRAGDLVSSGANDAYGPGGRPYWPSQAPFDTDTDEDAGPDYRRGYDSNERERNKILVSVIAGLLPEEEVRPEEMSSEQRATLVQAFKDRLAGSGILDLTEFGRAVHAEMAALMSCARTGTTPDAGTLYCTTFPCHNCAKHIVAAGVKTVVYVEPYPKSKAKLLHADAIVLPDEDEKPACSDDLRVRFRAFEGIGPRRFVDLFSLALGNGRPLRRKQKDADGSRTRWIRGVNSVPRLSLDPRSYLDREDTAAQSFARERGNHATIASASETDGDQAQ